MTDRDNVIDGKLEFLRKKKAEVEDQLSKIPVYITNMQIKTPQGVNINLRTINDLDALSDAFAIVDKIRMSRENFHTIILDLPISCLKVKEIKICGYTWADWVQDFKSISSKITLNETLKKINDSLASLEKFYSDDRKDANAFNDLLNKINNI